MEGDDDVMDELARVPRAVISLPPKLEPWQRGSRITYIASLVVGEVVPTLCARAIATVPNCRQARSNNKYPTTISNELHAAECLTGP